MEQRDIAEDRLDRYEIAQETICFMMAMRTDAIHEEKEKAEPDTVKIAKLEQEFNQFDHELYSLRIDDDDAVQRVFDKYSPVLKAEFECRRNVTL